MTDQARESEVTDQAREVEVRTPDGGTIRARSIGRGPAVVVLHGGGVRAQDYRRFAAALASRCTVVTYDRRSVAEQGSPDPYAVFDDLRAVLTATGATRLFGHSIGGFLALDAARRMPLDAVAVYDPAVMIDDLYPTAFFEPFARAVEAGDQPRAIAVVGRGLRASGRASDLPFPVQVAIAKLFLRTPIGRRMGEGLPEVVREDRLAIEAAGQSSAYAGITARLLLAYGGRSPAYYRPTCDRLAAAVPGARSLRLPRGSHNAPNIARPSFTVPFADFFAA
jgi:pimeloyl-ACP methyl ester carboxylesterase